jgi:hypothetical protein
VPAESLENARVGQGEPSGRVLSQEVKEEKWNVAPSRRERRHRNSQPLQTRTKIGAKPPGTDGDTQRVLSRSQEANVDGDGLRFTERNQLVVFDDAEELRLNFERQIRDLVEEQRSPLRRTDEPGVRTLGAREGALSVTEELGSSVCRLVDGAVDRQERARSTAAAVDGARELLLARSGRALEHCRKIARSSHFQLTQEVPQVGAAEEVFVEE